jgi:hypothetical protein
MELRQELKRMRKEGRVKYLEGTVKEEDAIKVEDAIVVDDDEDDEDDEDDDLDGWDYQNNRMASARALIELTDGEEDDEDDGMELF